MSLNKLYYNEIVETVLSNGVEYSFSFRHDGDRNKRFRCPYCGVEQFFWVKRSVQIPVNKPLNFNSLVSFTWECCNSQTVLNVAVHKSKGVNDLKLQVSVEPIPDEWWMIDGAF